MSDSTTEATEQGEIQDLNVDLQPSRFDLIAWRRSRVIELLGTGKNQKQISEILQVHESTISLDIKHLREEAIAKHGEYVENLPMRHKVRIAAIDKAIAELWTLFEKETDSRTKKGILDSITDALLAQAQLDADPAAIDRALKATAKIHKQIEAIA